MQNQQNSASDRRTAVIAGGGPAGLTAAYELATRSRHICPLLFEATDMLGGISRTVSHNGNRMDIGGHRFFSKEKRVTDRWEELMTPQSSPALDDLLMGDTRTGGESDPEEADRVMLRRRRVSRIYYLRRFFDYPVTMSLRTLRAMGLGRTLCAGFGFLLAKITRRPDDTLENFYINRFGKPLYRMFFEDYTAKVWGIHPSKLDADWGSQRVKGLSVTSILRDMTMKMLGIKGKGHVETSLIEEFVYPKYGPGQLWELTGEEAVKRGAVIEMNTAVTKVHIEGKRVAGVTVTDSNGKSRRVDCDYLISSMPLRDLVAAIEGVDIPADVARIAAGLPYRDFITVGLLVDSLKIKNQTKLRTFAGRIPDTWIYVQERDVRLGRIQVFNNWSPYMVKDYEHTMWIGLEYFCAEGDKMWQMSDKEFIDMAAGELASIGIIERDAVRDAVRIKVRKAYPAYFGVYRELDTLKAWLDGFGNLFCVGRNGQHRYNNMDHSMMTAMETADAILGGSEDHTRIWNVNTETDYHETK